MADSTRVSTTTVPAPVVTPPSTTAPPADVPGTVATFRPAATTSSIGGCDLYPRDHFLNATNVDTLPILAKSDAYVAGLGGGAAQLGFTNGTTWQGARSGMPINVVDSRVIGYSDVVFNPWGNPKTYKGPYPIPSNPMVQGHPSVQWDRHVLIVDVADCSGYELIEYDPSIRALTGSHAALNGTRYSLSTTERPALTTNAPRTPMIGQYVMFDEVQAGSIDHPIGFCSNAIGKGYVWPARASDGPVDSTDAPPMGSWLRLRADADLSELGPQAKVVADALREHGAILTDSCPHDFYLLGENTSMWTSTDIETLSTLSPTDFEAVDSSQMMIDPSSFAIR